jgi:uncharacterized protein YjbI with pentapeptide repeats
MKQKPELKIVDIDGNILQSVYVQNPANGFRGANLEGLNGTYAQLQGIDFSNAKLYWATLRDADLSFAIFAGADLRGAILERAICKSAIFKGANLGRDNLGGSTSLLGADLESSDLTDCNLDGAIYDDQTKLPPNFDAASRGMISAAGTSNMLKPRGS